MLTQAGQGAVRSDANAWPLAYIGPLFGLLLAMGFCCCSRTTRPFAVPAEATARMTLHLYFGKRFLKNFFSVLIIFFAILMLTGLIEQIRRQLAAMKRPALARLVVLATLSVPAALYRILAARS